MRRGASQRAGERMVAAEQHAQGARELELELSLRIWKLEHRYEHGFGREQPQKRLKGTAVRRARAALDGRAHEIDDVAPCIDRPRRRSASVAAAAAVGGAGSRDSLLTPRRSAEHCRYHALAKAAELRGFAWGRRHVPLEPSAEREHFELHAFIIRHRCAQVAVGSAAAATAAAAAAEQGIEEASAEGGLRRPWRAEQCAQQRAHAASELLAELALGRARHGARRHACLAANHLD